MFLVYKEDRINFIRGISAPLLFLSPFVFGLPEGYEILTVLLIWGLLNDINHILHLHVHHPFTAKKPLNVYLDASMAMVTGMTASNWRIQHVFRHHDENIEDYGGGMPWEMRRFTILGAISFSFRTIFPIFLMPIFESFRRGVLQNQKLPINFRRAFIAQLFSFVVLAGLFCWNRELTIWYALPWYFLVHFLTRYVDYLNHFGTDEGRFSHANNSLNRLYNKLGCNFGYHTAHHLFPQVHWSELPTKFSDIECEIDDKYKKTYSWSGFAMPWHFWLSLRSKM